MNLKILPLGLGLALMLAGETLHAQQSEAARKKFEEIKAEAEKGEAAAQFQLGYNYHSGHGITQDFREAVKWYRKAAEQSYPSAQVKLYIMLRAGVGVEKDLTKAMEFLKAAADQGNAEALEKLGMHISKVRASSRTWTGPNLFFGRHTRRTEAEVIPGYPDLQKNIQQGMACRRIQPKQSRFSKR